MFDLFRSREKAVRILLGALLVLVGLSMLTYLIPSYNTGAPGGEQSVVAEVNKEPITQLEVQKILQNSMRGGQIPPAILPTYVPQLVNNLVTERALVYEAQRLGYQVTDAEISQAIRQYLPQLFQDGQFVGKEAYAQYLAQQNMTIPEFEADVRRQLLVTRMRDVAVQGVVVTPQEIEQEYRRKNEKVKVEYVKFSSDKYKAEVQPTLDDMQQYFKLNQSRYTMPERRNMTLLIADQSKLEQTVSPTDADLQRIYTQEQAQFRVPEQVKVRHILLKTQGKPASEDAAIKAKADDILKQVKAGANFGDLVKKYSEDTASVPNGGEYTVQRNGQMVPEFENAAFTLKPGESEVVKTTYGYHIVQVMQHDPARLKPFEEVRAQIAEAWKKQRVSDMMQQIEDKAQPMLQKDPLHPEKVAQAFNMQVVPVADVEAGKPVAEIGPSPDFDQAITGLKKGEVSAPVAIAGNKIVIAVVTDVQPSRPANFAEVQTQVHDAMVQARLAAAVQKHAKELADQAKANGGDLAKVAKSMGLEVKTSDEVTRTGAIEGVGSASYIQEAFRDPDGTVFGPIPTPDATIVVKVISHTQPDMTKLAEQRNTIRDSLKSQKAREMDGIFETGLREALIRQGKIKMYPEVIKRMIGSYTGA
jgi:peptidyl-prolyl cis-trans isomerase D